ALCCFDYCLTFSREVRYVHQARQSLTSFLFYVLRYTALFNTIFEILELLPAWKGENDLVLFSAIRVYALFARNVPIFTITLALGLVNPAIWLASGGRRWVSWLYTE
ncbi:hypothetical protein OBBRIDRAFT_732855, partial [Obba rivulosa]